MPALIQSELIENLIALNVGAGLENIEKLIWMTTNYVEVNQLFFPDEHLEIFDEIAKEESNFERIFSVALNSPSVKERPLRIFLPAALHDVCTDHKHDLIGRTGERIVSIIRDVEEHPEAYPEPNESYSNIVHYGISLMEHESSATKIRTAHTLNTGNLLIEFLKSHIEVEKQVVVDKVQNPSSCVDVVATAAIP